MEFKAISPSSSTNICNKIREHLDRVFPTNKIETARQYIRQKELKPSLSCLNMFYSPIKPKKRFLSNSLSSKELTSSPKSSSNASFKELRSTNSKDWRASPKKVSIETLSQELREERDKNKQYCQEINILKKRLIDLEGNIGTSPSPTFNRNKSTGHLKTCCNKNLTKIIKENESLKVFKRNVYDISKNYDDVNENIINNLKRIELVFDKLIKEKKTMSNDVKIATMEVGYVSFEKVVNIVIDMMKHKQEEFNFLIQQKDNDIDELKLKISNYTAKNRRSSENTFSSINADNYNCDILKHGVHSTQKFR